VTAEAGYSINDVVILSPGMNDWTNNRGISIVPDATNLVIRYGSVAQPIAVNDKTTGNATALTNANWTVTFRAWV
jgi:hypothetical protein